MNKFQSGLLAAACALLAPAAARALDLVSVSPQGTVSQVRQVVAKFNEPAVNFGDPKAPAPLVLSCDNAQASKGTGRWTGEREWVFDLQDDMPPGVRCTLQPASGFKSPKGQALPAAARYAFNTGGPFVRNTWPYGGQVEEDQFFVMELNGDASVATVQGNLWCSVAGLGEQVPARLLDEKQRAATLKVLGLEKAAAKAPLRYLAFACNRRLPAGTKMQVVYGKGIATPSGVANTEEKRFNFQVREAFAASFSCERENAQAPCLPIRPMRLQFNAPVTRKMAERIKLEGPKGTIKPSAQADAQDDESTVNGVTFATGLPQEAELTLDLPRDFADAAGRPLRNASSFPLKVRTGVPPPLAKFAASHFGIVERLAEPGAPALLPLTVRNVEADLRVQSIQPATDAQILEWLHRLESARSVRWDDREKPYLARNRDAKKLELPKSDGKLRPFEVVGIPLPAGFHVVEIESHQLGTALLDPALGPQRPMYVRTSALVTNLGVHLKIGRETSMAWVTTLDKGQPVAGAVVALSDCSGKRVAGGTTDARGVVDLGEVAPNPRTCGNRDSSYFASARAKGPDGVQDLAFTRASWQRGIEPWRFNLPTSQAPQPDQRAHTVLDRPLLRAGETVSFKHYIRTETRKGFGLPGKVPTTQVVTHLGSGQQYSQAIAWRKTPTGGLSAVGSFAIPPAAKLGQYQVELKGSENGEGDFQTASFRVEEFRLPVLEGRVGTPGKKALVHVKETPVEVQVNYVSGGPAVNLPVRVSALLRPRGLAFDDYDAFSFSPPQRARQGGSADAEEESAASADERVVADKLPVTLDKSGLGKVTVANLPVTQQPQELVLEASYPDPNGEVQTLRSTQPLWPAGVVAGIRTEGWVSASQQIKFQALALDIQGRPAQGVPLEVRATARVTTTARKRMVGGFYSYDNKVETKDLGAVCSGRSDSRGLLLCEAKLGEPGEVELVATAKDADGNTSQAASSVWVTRQGELWFGGEDHDRIDVLPEKKAYQPGETARLQVRMPFRFATALVTVEREGVIQSEVVQLNGQDPTVHVKIDDGWAPNVFVNVLVLRGRLREVPWYSFFTWGYKAPREWWTAFWYEGREYVAPTALVDLSKPAYRMGVAELRVGARAHQLDVKVTTDQPTYQVRGTARVTVTAKLPNGQPAAGAEVALAAVDQALLELMPNTTWNLLDAMLQRRAWGVETSTAQMEIIGRRHYGRKAVPAGGGGSGGGSVRELLETLLLWNPAIVLDANGKATVNVPLNDALTTFRIVAVADASTGLFGTGEARIRSTQDLQIISGLPPLVREDDQFRAQLTLRNTTTKAMKVEVKPRATLLDLAAQTIDLPAGEAREVAWNVTAPGALAFSRAEAILWEIEARDTMSGARDALKARQRIVPAVPLTVQQATLVQLDGPYSLDVKPPADALPGRGGLKLALQPKLAEGLPGVRDWFAAYPFICLEQKTSKSIGLRDAGMWKSVLAQMPGYLDADGLASYFPPRDGESNRGSDTLTAYILAAAHEASGINPAFSLPDEMRAPMEQGLAGFIEGRITRDHWSPRKDLDVRKLAALEALSRYGKAQGRMAGSISITPNQWPTSAVIDWINILKRVPDVAQREQRLAEAMQVLKARLSWQGTKLVFSTERDDYWWWLMASGDLNTARLLLAVMDDPAWKGDMGRLANGFILRQQGGAWHTTTANLWGGMALEKFSAKYEAAPVAGSTRAALGGNTGAVDWAKVERVKTTDAAGAPHQTTAFGAPASPGNLRNNGMLLPWDKDAAAGTLTVTHQGSGKPWLTLQSVAAVALKQPFAAGYQVKRSVTPVEQAVKGQYTRGDVLRVTVEVNASADMTWVVLSDPVPGGATILGTGLGRDSEISSRGEKREGWAWPAFEERSFEAFRSYYEYVPKGSFKVEYTIRLNNVGEFSLPPTRIEAMYAPEMFGEAPNPRLKVEAAK